MGQHHESPINQGAQLSVMGDTFMGVLAQDRILQPKSGHSPFHSAAIHVFKFMSVELLIVIPIIRLMFEGSIVIFPILFLILIIYVISLFSGSVLLEICQFYSDFQRTSSLFH